MLVGASQIPPTTKYLGVFDIIVTRSEGGPNVSWKSKDTRYLEENL